MTPPAGPLWTAPDVAAAVRGSLSGHPASPVTGVSIDTRSLAPGDLFVALAGPHRDGHEFVAEAMARGAGAALVTHPPGGVAPDAPLVVVDDTQLGLERLGAAARARTGARIAAITGSVGKTGTKEMLALALAEQGAAHRSESSYNNLWGLPLSLARMPRETEFGIFEIGMNHPGEITPLTRLARPDVAVVTAIEHVHLEFFSGLEAIADAKAEIFLGLSPLGSVVLNRDNAMYERLAAAAAARGIGRIRSFGVHDAAHVRLFSTFLGPESSTVRARIDGREVNYRLSQPGRHMVMNSLAVLATVAALGADPFRAAQALIGFEGLHGRGRRVEIRVRGGTASLLDESYNASPAAVRAALAVLGFARGRRVVVLGDMRELGAAGPELHRGLADAIEAAGVAVAFTCGELAGTLFEALPEAIRGAHARSAAALLPHLAAALQPGDTVMVKGSLGSRMADIVKPLIAGIAADGTGSESGC